MAYRGLAESQTIADLASRKALSDEFAKACPLDASSRRVAISVDRREAVLLDPVSNGRRVPAGQLANGFKRQPAP
jgi:hypothetical protein